MIFQANLQGEKAEPYEGICCKACWHAKGEKCVCKCNGVHHGKGNPDREEQNTVKRNRSNGRFERIYPSAQKYKQLMTDKHCYCGYDLSNEPVYAYAHEDGWEVEETDEPQWLYIKCPNRRCKNEMAIWKLGVLREAKMEDLTEDS